ncbi:MAG: hypothetical protein ACO3YS_02235 [Burkholderiaceae bacterium]
MLDADAQDAPLVNRLAQSLRDQGFPVQVMQQVGNTLGSDQAVRSILEDIRNMTTSQAGSAVVLCGVGLSASLALWADLLDGKRQFAKRTNTGRGTIFEQVDRTEGPVLAGVVAVSPFLGFDLSVSSLQVGGWDALRERILRLARVSWLSGVFKRVSVAYASDHGCWAPRVISWWQLARCLPFASFAKIIPSLKRPTTLLFDQRSGSQTSALETLLRALNGRLHFVAEQWTPDNLGRLVAQSAHWCVEQELARD